jgi:hypothetical protein
MCSQHIIGFQLQQCLCDRATMLRHVCIAYVIYFLQSVTPMNNISLKVRGYSELSAEYKAGCVWNWLWPILRHHPRNEHEGTEERKEMNNLE